MKQTRENLADMTDLVFENRNQDYGAYVLRKRYPYVLGKALSFTIGLIIIFLGSSGFGTKEELKAKDRPMVIACPIAIPTLPKEKEIPTIRPEVPKAPDISTTSYHIPEPTPADELNKEEITATIHDLDSLRNANRIGIRDIEGDHLDLVFWENFMEDSGDIPEVIGEESEPSSNIVVIPDEAPVPVNMKKVWSQAKYPRILSQNGEEGIVVMRILIDEEGNYVKHKVLNSAHPLFTQEVEKLVDQLRFTPAIQGGKGIKFWVNLPFRFSLVR